tara:strand:- start:204 stop:473 length:270 start_codon:yes stop_codon:yes gene_type:complete
MTTTSTSFSIFEGVSNYSRKIDRRAGFSPKINTVSTFSHIFSHQLISEAPYFSLQTGTRKLLKFQNLRASQEYQYPPKGTNPLILALYL